MTIPKQTAINLLDRAKKSLLQELSDELVGLERELLIELEGIDSDCSVEGMLVAAKELIRYKLQPNARPLVSYEGASKGRKESYKQ